MENFELIDYVFIVFGALFASMFILMFVAFVRVMWDMITGKW